MVLLRSFAPLALGLVLVSSAASADPRPTIHLSLREAVTRALAKSPALLVARSHVDASAATLDEAHTIALPGLGVGAELNRSTGNTAPGAFAPVPGVVPVAGAPKGRAIDSGAWQTGVSVWASWDATSPFRESAASNVAQREVRVATAGLRAAELDAARAAADAFLIVLVAHEGVKAARSSLERARVVVTVAKALVEGSLRPSVDVARAEAEAARAEIAVTRAEQVEALALVDLAESLGDASLAIEPEPGALLVVPPNDTAAASSVHPLLQEASAEVDRLGVRRRAIDLQYLPRIDLLAALWGRGSGLYDSPAAGLAPDIANWFVGITLSWNALEIPMVRARARLADASIAGAVAARDALALALSARVATASARLSGARAIAATTPVALAAAQSAEAQTLARYQAGLAPINDVADAERVLAQAAADDAVARLEIRRAELTLAWARGDLGPFLESAR